MSRIALVVKMTGGAPVEIGVDCIEVLFRTPNGDVYVSLEDEGLYVNAPAADLHVVPSATNALYVKRFNLDTPAPPAVKDS